MTGQRFIHSYVKSKEHLQNLKYSLDSTYDYTLKIHLNEIVLENPTGTIYLFIKLFKCPLFIYKNIKYYQPKLSNK